MKLLNNRTIISSLSPWVVSISQARDLENTHHEKVTDIANVTLEKLIKNELEEEISEDLRMVRWSRIGYFYLIQLVVLGSVLVMLTSWKFFILPFQLETSR